MTWLVLASKRPTAPVLRMAAPAEGGADPVIEGVSHAGPTLENHFFELHGAQMLVADLAGADLLHDDVGMSPTAGERREPAREPSVQLEKIQQFLHDAASLRAGGRARAPPRGLPPRSVT